MPATEKTWRDQLRMHVIFGISALVMLGGTIWMLAKDHNREWRKWQLADRSREAWTIEAQLAQAQATSQSKRQTMEAALESAQTKPIDEALIEQFRKLVIADDSRLKLRPSDFGRLDTAKEQIKDAKPDTPELTAARTAVLDAMNQFTREAQRREDALVTAKKFVAAKQTAAISARGIAVGEGRPTAKIDEAIQERADEIAQLEADVAAAKVYRMALEAIVKDIRSEELDLEKQIAAIDTDLKRLRDSLGQYSTSPGEWLNRGPVLDALYTGNIKLDQIWLPDMKINYNFSYVARYDRCINCHRAIDKTAPGSATEPAYPAVPRDQRDRIVELQTPDAQPTATKAENGDEIPPTLTSAYGVMLADRGQVNPDDVTIQAVFPESLAAKAGLEMGDVISEINGGRVHAVAEVEHYFLELADWGKPVPLKIRRGLDQPYTSHPRLDLFVGSTSPHKKGDMGCTICHDGQGSATEFKWASHTPNDPQQALDWSRRLGWFDNHHWIFPMTPERFVESNCLKCHHEVVELEPSDRFPEPPAPKLVHGYELVRQYGCYGCHEINGFDGPNKRIGPDLRAEPNFAEVAAQILTDKGLNDDERGWTEALLAQPADAAARDQLARAIQADAAPASAARGNGATASGSAGGSSAAEQQRPRLSPATYALADGLKDVETPGRLRKVGPSLRHLDSKVDFNWVYDWIRRPADFRPTTRMPQYFGHFEHLDPEKKEFLIHDAARNEQLVTDREYTERFEKIEIRALAEFLLADSQPYEYIDPPQGVTEAPSADRGKWLFQSRGCLACHSHREFAGIASNQGPDLSRVGAKLNTAKGQRWLYSWLKAPNSYHARTVMPNLFLEPIVEKDPAGNPTGHVTDPAADIATFLLGVPADWQPEAVPSRELSADEAQALEELTAVWLTPSFASKKLAEKYAHEGIPEDLRATMKVDEKVLVGMSPANRTQRQLEYIARRSLSRYGCFGCHDIPGYETAKLIGTPLVGWGRKDTSQLAFENIAAFLETHGIDGTADEHVAASLRSEIRRGEDANASLGETRPSDHISHADSLDPVDQIDPSVGFFLQSLTSHQRTGFLWQKLRMPRSFDYQATRNKRYDERLRMPRFPFNDAQREAVMTFVLGLTNEAPAERYIYKPNPRQNAIVQGRHVLDKYNCAGCHMLDMERWDVAFPADWFGDPPTTNDYPFLAPQVTGDEVKASLTPDERGLLRAELHGMPARDEVTGAPRLVDEDGVPIEPDDTESQPYYEFVLFKHAVVAGAPRRVGSENLQIKANRDGSGPAWGTAYPGLGGDLAKYLYPHVIAEEKKINPAAVANEAWGWLPPPLDHEGEKVQTEWLHDFLMDPTALRPAVVMRMPNFHMSSGEASMLVNYFAAKSNAEFPYEYNERRRGGYLAQLEAAHPGLLNDGMKIYTDGNYCVKCHSLGDYQVKGAVKTLGPNLDQIYRRLRPEYLRRWVANPQRILPYTGMPVNIPYDPTPPNFGGVNQALFPGPSTAQLDGLVDMLMNFDEYARRQTSVKGLVKEPPAPTGQPAAAAKPTKPRGDQSAAQ